MARPLKGSVERDDRWASPTFALRFTAHGERQWVTLGSEADGWTQTRAERELANVLADVRRGIWHPPAPVQAPAEAPTFHEFASEWFERQKVEGGRGGQGLTAAGAADLRWRLCDHLLPVFARKRLDEITVEDVDRYRLTKVRERARVERAAAAGRPLMEVYTDPHTGRTRRRQQTAIGPTSINKTLQVLAAILEAAVEYGHVPRNVARGRRRRLPAVAPGRSWLDRADQIAALLDGATALDNDARARKGQRRALLATLTFAGLRIGEALALTWADVDLARGTIRVRAGKTAAAARTVYVLPALGDELRAYAAGAKGDPAGLVFATTNGKAHGATNVRRRVLAPAIAKANEQLAEPIPATITPHSLRRTFASILFAIGESPVYVMGQMGHTTAELTLAIYARQMDRRDGEPERLRALVEGREFRRGNGGDTAEPIREGESTIGADR